MFGRNNLVYLLALPEFFLHAAAFVHLVGGKSGLYGPDTGYIFVGGVSQYPSVQLFYYIGQVGFILKHFIAFDPVLIDFFGFFLKSVLNL